MIANWDRRGGYLKPVEHADPIGLDALLLKDVAVLAAQ
jgi:hypothetical protein